jgi:hypothetical protein
VKKRRFSNLNINHNFAYSTYLWAKKRCLSVYVGRLLARNLLRSAICVGPTPDDPEVAIGRTGRAGARGEAISFVAKDNFRNLCAIESHLGHVITRKTF